MKVRDLVPDLVQGEPIKIRNLYNIQDLDCLNSQQVSLQTVTVRNNSTGEIIGRRSVWQR